jgi:hypothetical protein
VKRTHQLVANSQLAIMQSTSKWEKLVPLMSATGADHGVDRSTETLAASSGPSPRRCS